MGCKTARFSYDSDTPQAVAAGGTVLFSSASSRTPAIVGNGSGGVLLRAPGTYKVLATFTLSGTAAGTVNVQMSGNSTPVPGARAGATFAAEGDLATVTVADTVGVGVGSIGSYATLTFAPDAAVGVRTATVLVERA